MVNSSSRWGETPSVISGGSSSSTFDIRGSTATPLVTSGGGGMISETPSINSSGMAMETPALSGANRFGVTPGMTPIRGSTLDQVGKEMHRWGRELYERNRNYTDAELDELFPPGYRVLLPPDDYEPDRSRINYGIMAIQ